MPVSVASGTPYSIGLTCVFSIFLYCSYRYFYGKNRGFSNGTPICNTALMGNMGSTYDGPLCDTHLGTSQV